MYMECFVDSPPKVHFHFHTELAVFTLVILSEEWGEAGKLKVGWRGGGWDRGKSLWMGVYELGGRVAEFLLSISLTTCHVMCGACSQ